MLSSRFLIAISGAATFVYAAADLAARQYWREKPEIERVTCRFFICMDRERTSEVYQALLAGDETVDAVAEFRAALRREPVSAYRWADVGEALFQRGETQAAADAFNRALQLAPNSPTILLRASTFHFRSGRSQNALPYTSRILKLIPDYDGIVFSYYGRMGIPNEDILRSGLGDSARASREYLRYLLRSAPEEVLRQTWNVLLERGMSDDQVADDYVRTLVSRKLFAAARQAWIAHLQTQGSDPNSETLIFNGGFEEEPSNEVFNWNIQPSGSVEVNRDVQERHSGLQSLHLRFAGKDNVHFRDVRQVIAIEPGTYRISGYVRAQQLTTDKGVSLRVVHDAAADVVLARTPAVVGTSGWTPVEATFSVGQLPGPLRVEVAREESFRLDNQIKGDAWVDSVRLEKLNNGSGREPKVIAAARAQ